ncbi:hypothetical protein GOP47_0007830 [Adiantum capillus-veneris]|uniref:Uncharacterized protein n=1 Tax=Adiantum capillus-veneris TaxID=13818 RepID=A0A9D4V247_ADICA|nr:hypothetical protein GOP47_0007830 [Adiantum capillus-veneris]
MHEKVDVQREEAANCTRRGVVIYRRGSRQVGVWKKGWRLVVFIEYHREGWKQLCSKTFVLCSKTFVLWAPALPNCVIRYCHDIDPFQSPTNDDCLSYPHVSLGITMYGFLVCVECMSLYVGKRYRPSLCLVAYEFVNARSLICFEVCEIGESRVWVKEGCKLVVRFVFSSISNCLKVSRLFCFV